MVLKQFPVEHLSQLNFCHQLPRPDVWRLFRWIHPAVLEACGQWYFEVPITAIVSQIQDLFPYSWTAVQARWMMLQIPFITDHMLSLMYTAWGLQIMVFMQSIDFVIFRLHGILWYPLLSHLDHPGFLHPIAMSIHVYKYMKIHMHANVMYILLLLF